MKVMWVVVLMVMLSGCAEFMPVAGFAGVYAIGVGLQYNSHQKQQKEKQEKQAVKLACDQDPECDPETLNPNKPISVQGLKDSADKFTTGIGRLIGDPSIVFEGADKTTEDKKQETGE